MLSSGDVFELCTGFKEFQQGSIEGLWLVDGRHIDILAVLSTSPGRGEFSKFLQSLMDRSDRIRFLHVENDHLRSMLRRRGFIECEWFHIDELVSGMRWKRGDHAF